MKKLGRFYSIEEVGEMYGVQPDTVYSWIYEKDLDAYLLYGIVRISEFHLEVFINDKMILTDVFI